METFTIRDLRERTGELVRNAEAGKLAIVSKHGTPIFVAVPFDETVFDAGVRSSMAIKLFSEGSLTLRGAAKFAGVPLEDMMTRLGKQGIPVIDYDPNELHEEVAAYGTAPSRRRKSTHRARTR